VMRQSEKTMINLALVRVLFDDLDEPLVLDLLRLDFHDLKTSSLSLAVLAIRGIDLDRRVHSTLMISSPNLVDDLIWVHLLVVSRANKTKKKKY
jgi:uncharacterized protein with PhoU and TrkA domain